MTDLAWITDRLPTKADGDCDGDVLVRTRPGHGSDRPAYCHWTLVRRGLSWRHADSWRPPASRLDFKVGQRWRRRDGEIVTVTQITSSDGGCYADDSAGTSWGYWSDGTAPSCSSCFDLVELLEDVPPVPLAPVITKTESELICTFEYGGRTYQAVATPAEPTVRERALRLVADYGVANYQFTAKQVATIRAALEAES